MTTNSPFAVSFTGHRKERILQDSTTQNVQFHLTIQIAKLYMQGYRTFYSGMANGLDLLAATVVMHMKRVYKDIRMVAVVPFANQSARYDEQDKLQYATILKQADEVVILSEHYYTGCFHHRNDYLIDHASVMVAYWDNVPKGGTYYTVSRAKRMNKEIINLYK